MLSIQTIVISCIGLIICVTPLTLHLFWLATLNRRERPTVVDGSWDFIALLTGLLGCLVFAGVTCFFLAREMLHSLGRDGFDQVWAYRFLQALIRVAVGVGYPALILGLCYLSLRNRRGTLSIYNIDAMDCDYALKDLFANLGITASRFGNRWSDGKDLLEIVPFHALKHVQIRILTSDPRLHEELERQIRSVLPRCKSPDNPASPWISTAAITGFLMVLVCVFLLFVAMYVVG